jgi:hypothetical protein
MAHEAPSEVDRNYEAFLAVLPDIISAHAGKFALLHDCQIVGYFDTALAATLDGHREFGAGWYSVQEVTSEPEHLGFYSYVGSAEQC